MFMRCTGSTSSSSAPTNGRWSANEHTLFLEALNLYGREWKRVADYIKTRNSAQIRSHAQKYFAKLEKESAKGIHGGAAAIHGDHVVLADAYSHGSKKKKKRKRRQPSNTLGKKIKVSQYNGTHDLLCLRTGSLSSSSSSGMGDYDEYDNDDNANFHDDNDTSDYDYNQSIAMVNQYNDRREERGSGGRFRTIQSERSVSPTFYNRRYVNGSSSPKTARVRVQGGTPYLEEPKLQLDADMSQMSALLRKRELIVQKQSSYKNHAGYTKDILLTISNIDENIQQLYQNACNANKPCMCRRLCHVVHCRACNTTTTTATATAASTDDDTSTLNFNEQPGCVTTRRNLLFLVQSSFKAHSIPNNTFEKSMLSRWNVIKMDLDNVETNKSSISMYETAQIFAGMSQEAQARLQDLNETELTAVQVLVGTRMGLKPIKSPIKLTNPQPSPTPQTESRRASLPNSPQSEQTELGGLKTTP